MIHMAPFLEKWLCSMTWVVCRNASTLPFLTSDNPAVMFADRGASAEIGVGFQEPALQVLIPLTPKMCLRIINTAKCLDTTANDTPESEVRFTDVHPLMIGRAHFGIEEAVRVNQVTVSNAERYVYANGNDQKVHLFLNDLFFGRPGPVRRFDRRPIGSRIDCASNTES